MLPQAGWTSSPLQYLKRVLGYAMVGGLAAMMASTFIACTFNPPGARSCSPHSDPTCSTAVDYHDGVWFPEEIDLIAETAPLATPTVNRRWRADNGYGAARFQSHHGYSCAEATRAWVELTNEEDVVGISFQDSIALPPGHTGMVYLNGWHLGYTGSDDHKVKGLGIWITNVRQENNELHWDAGGVLTDKNADDAFRAVTIILS